MVLLLSIFLCVIIPLKSAKPVAGQKRNALPEHRDYSTGPKQQPSTNAHVKVDNRAAFGETSSSVPPVRTPVLEREAKNFSETASIQMSKKEKQVVPDKKNEEIVSAFQGASSSKDAKNFKGILNPRSITSGQKANALLELNSVAIMMLQVAKRRGNELIGKQDFADQAKQIDGTIAKTTAPEKFSEKSKNAANFAVSTFAFNKVSPQVLGEKYTYAHTQRDIHVRKEIYKAELENLQVNYQKVVKKIKELDPQSKLPDTLMVYTW